MAKVTVKNNSAESINSALLRILKGNAGEKETSSGTNTPAQVTKKETVIKLSDGETLDVKQMKNTITALSSALETSNKTIQTLAQTVQTLKDQIENINVSVNGNTINYTNYLDIDTESEITASAESSHYLGKFDNDNIPTEVIEGDWYFNSDDVKLYRYESFTWVEVEYNAENSYMYIAANTDLLDYAENEGQVGYYCAAFIANLSTLKILFKQYVASIQNAVPIKNDQLISMGKNPLKESDNYGFLLQKCVNTNPLIWQKYLWSDFKNDALDFGINGQLLMNNDIVFNQNLETSTMLSGLSTEPEDMCSDGNDFYIVNDGKLFKYDGSDYTEYLSFTDRQIKAVTFTNNQLYICTETNQTYPQINVMYYKESWGRWADLDYFGDYTPGEMEPIYQSNENGIVCCRWQSNLSILYVDILTSSGNTIYVSPGQIAGLNAKGIRDIAILKETVSIRVSKSTSILDTVRLDINTITGTRTVTDEGTTNDVKNIVCNNIVFKQQWDNLATFKWSYDNETINTFTLPVSNAALAFSIIYVNNMYFILDGRGNAFCSTNLVNWQEAQINKLGELVYKKAVFCDRLNYTLVLQANNIHKLTPVRFNFPIIQTSEFDPNVHYMKFSNGLIVQWGGKEMPTISSGSSKAIDITFPKAFTSSDYAVFSSAEANQSGEEFSIRNKTLTGCTVSLYNRNSGTSISRPTIRWLCIGF